MGQEENRTKFNVEKDKEKRTHNGITFDSVMEMRYYRDVVLPQVESGEIAAYELQKPYILQPKFTHDEKPVREIQYVADFYIEYSDGHKMVVDTKGCPDSVAKIKRKMFWYCYPELDYRWICYSLKDGGWCDYEVVCKARKERKKAKKLAEERKEKENEQGKTCVDSEV